ncbi:MAG: PD-(D/E)XK nuclease family protein [Clostridium sp.]|jgi:hypothetical protein|nr:PD-(D/E)XK nuclease family protein [Clostridium sp.]
MLNLQEIREFLENLPVATIKAKEFTLADIFRKNRNENFSSDWLAFILDPIHFKSYEPLNAFLRLLDIPTLDENQEVTVEREVSLGEYGRIDLLITTDDYLIGIENKIDAWTRENQCEDYAVALKEQKGEKQAVGVLLSPQSNGVLSANGFVDLSYEQLIEELKGISIDFINNLRSAFLLKDYITYMEENIMKNDVIFDIEDKTTAYLLGQIDKIDSINDLLATQKGNMKNYIESAMIDIASQLGVEWRVFVSGGAGYWQFYKNFWNDKDVNIHYEVAAITRSKNSLAYTSYQIVLHEESLKKPKHFRDGFKPIKAEIQRLFPYKEYNLDFSSNENFKKSLDDILGNLLSMAEKTSGMIDKYIAENANENIEQ